MTRSPFSAAVALTLGLALSGCSGEEFDPFGRLTSLRILAIQSEPVAPGPGESTTLTPLLYVPEDHGEPEFIWSWCPFAGSGAEGYPCEFDPSELAGDELGVAGIDLGIPPLELGSGETATLQNTVNPMMLAMICEGTEEAHAFINCDHGFPAQVKLTVRTDKEEVTAVRTLHLRYDATQANNTNPVLDGFQIKIDGSWSDADEDFSTLLERDQTTDVRALVSSEQAERYQGPAGDAEGERATVRERLNIGWFVESGSTRYQRTGFIENVSTFDILQENEWVPARSEDYSGETSEIIMVLRDNREGTSWQRFTVGLTEQP